jgi:anti-anti-sigma regulatory factor
MNDIVLLERRLAQAEELLNVLDALHPDLPPEELYELALQALCGAGEYAAGSLWVYRDSHYYSAAWQGLDRARSSQKRGAELEAGAREHLLGQLEARGGAHWGCWPLPPGAPALLQVAERQGHTLILPLAFTDQLGFAALEAGAPAPADEAIELLRRFADKIAVALDTARIVQEHLDTIETLQRMTEEQRRLQETVLALSAPLLPLLPEVLVLPLIGTIDARRAARILEAELEAIIREQAAVVLVDITGAPVVDTDVAMQIVRSAEAARLLGCRTILVGIQPEIAQTLVGLGVDLRGIATRATLADGLQEALRAIGQRITSIKPGM